MRASPSGPSSNFDGFRIGLWSQWFARSDRRPVIQLREQNVQMAVGFDVVHLASADEAGEASPVATDLVMEGLRIAFPQRQYDFGDRSCSFLECCQVIAAAMAFSRPGCRDTRSALLARGVRVPVSITSWARIMLKVVLLRLTRLLTVPMEQPQASAVSN